MGEVTIQQLPNNGVIVRGAGGRFLPGTRSPAPITHENARSLVKSHWDRKRQEFEAGIAQAIAETGMLPPGDDHVAGAWRVIGNKAATLLLDETNARNYASLLHEVRATVQDRDEPAVAGAAIGAVAGVVGAILAAIQAQRQGDELLCDAVEAEAHDADDVE